MGDKDGIKDIFTSIDLCKKSNYKNDHDKKYIDKWNVLASGYFFLCMQYDLNPQYIKKYSNLHLDAAFKSKKLDVIFLGYTAMGKRYMNEYQLSKKICP